MSEKTPSNNAEKKEKFSFSKIIYNDKYLLVLSIFIAIIIWVITSISVGAEETKTIKIDVPIQLGDQVSQQLGMEYYSLQDSVEVSVSISGAKYVVGQVSDSDLDISFDTSSINKTGDHNIPIVVTNKSKSLDYTIDSVYPSSIEGYYDVNTQKTFDVQLEYDENNIADGYTFGTPTLSEEKVVVSGPKTYVDKIESVYCQVDFGSNESLTESFNQDCDIHFEGDDIVTNYLTVTSRTDMDTSLSKISVTLPVLKVVELPVTTTFEDEPDGLSNGIVSVSYSTDSVKAGVLSTADISSANLGSIFFNELTVGTSTFDFSTDKLNGITILDNSKTITATVTVSSTYSEQTVYISSNDIVLEGADSDMTVQSVDDTTVTVLAPKGTTITSSDLTMTCNVSKKTDNNEYPITITVSNNKCWVYGKYNATIV